MLPFIFAFVCASCLSLFALYAWAKAKTRIETIHWIAVLKAKADEDKKDFGAALDWAAPYLSGKCPWSGLTNKELGKKALEEIKTHGIADLDSADALHLILYALGARLSDTFFVFCMVLVYAVVGASMRFFWYSLCKALKSKMSPDSFRGVLLQVQSWLKYRARDFALAH